MVFRRCLTITFPTIAGRTYGYAYSDDLQTWIAAPASTQAGTGFPQSYVIHTAAPASRFFRIHISHP